MSKSKLVIVGQGYVGLPLAMRAIEVGFDVVGFDVDVERVGRLVSGDSYVEDVPSERLAAALASGHYHPTTDLALCEGFSVAVISVPTPLREGLPDLSFIESSAQQLGRFVRRGSCVILESTTYPGTTTEIVGPILERVSGLIAGQDFYLGYSPERIDPGNSEWRLENTPKLISAVNSESLSVVRSFYERLVESTVEVRGVAEAELAKLIENTFAMSISPSSTSSRWSPRSLELTYGKQSVWHQRSPSDSCPSILAQGWEGTASRSTPLSCPGGSKGRWGTRFALSRSPTTSTITCPITSYAAYCSRLIVGAGLCAEARSSCLASPTSEIRVMLASHRQYGLSSSSLISERSYGSQTLTSVRHRSTPG